MSEVEANQAEVDAIGALDALANAVSELDEHNFPNCPPVGESAPHRAKTRREKEALQKWVQCAKCQKWRKVPYNLADDELNDDWECKENVWDKSHASCSVPQALSNEEIDHILALQQGDMEGEEEEEEEEVEEVEGEFEEADGYEEEEIEDDVEEGGSEEEEEEAEGLTEAEVAGRGGKRSRRGTRFRQRAKRTATVHSPTPGARSRRRGRGDKPISRPVPTAVFPIRGKRGRAYSRTPVAPQRVSFTNRIPGAPASARPRGRRGTGRSRGGRATGRFGKGVNEAAEALLDMGLAFEGVENEEHHQPLQWPYARGLLRPGKVVWAKVEGHDWWPARIVRRRAVPREVGPPPGGSVHVRNFIPVVFFTAKGIPGEVDEGMDTEEGVMNASRRALGLVNTNDDDEEEEAEYAWLSPTSIKPFRAGEGLSGSEDATLQASIDAAETALRAAGQHNGGEDDEGVSDSDGGWAVQATALEPALSSRMRGRGRGSRGRRGRGRGGRRGRGRRGNGTRGVSAEDDEGSESEYQDVANSESYPLSSYMAQKVVEQIYGWRYPLSEKEKVQERNRLRALEAERVRKLQNLQLGPARRKTGLSKETYSEGRKAGTAEEEIPQEEADAVAALLDFGSEDNNVGPPVLSAAGLAAPREEAEYLVKYINYSHVHNEWVSESILMQMAKRKLLNFKKKVGSEPCNLMEEAWCEPERFVARRPSPSGPGWEVLVKWKTLGYEHCTWESENEPMLMQPECMHLHTALWDRQKRAASRATPRAAMDAAAARRLAEHNFQELTDQPAFVAGGELHPHQISGLNWLRSMWVGKKNAILADEMGLGKTATIIAFLQSLLHEYQVTNPVLVVVPVSMLSLWEGEWNFWAARGTNTVSYAGSVAARMVLLEQELWLLPCSMDSKSANRIFGMLPAKQVPKPDVVVTTYETISSDIAALKSVSWEAVVVDARQRSKSSAGKAQAALHELQARQRVLLTSAALPHTPTDLLSLLTFVRPEIQDMAHAVGHEAMSAEQQSVRLRQLLQPYCCRRVERDVGNSVNIVREFLLPVDFTPTQADFYVTTLARQYEALTDPRSFRNVTYRAATLRHIFTELRKVCNHPTLLAEYEHERERRQQAGDDDDPEGLRAACGKLGLLDLLVQALWAQGSKVLLLVQSSKTLSVVESFFKLRYSADCYERVDGEVAAAERYAAVARFRASGADGPLFLFMTTARSCGLGLELPNIGAVVVYDSDTHPRLDVQALRRAHRLGDPQQELPLFRIYVRQSVEERMLQLVERRKGLQNVLRPGPLRQASASGRVLDEVLKWGVANLFRAKLDDGKEGGAGAGAPDGGSEDYGPAAGLVKGLGKGMKAENGSSGGAKVSAVVAGGKLVYTPDMLASLLERVQRLSSGAGRPAGGATGGSGAAERSSSSGTEDPAHSDGNPPHWMALGPPFEHVMVRDWADMEKIEEDADEELDDDDGDDEADTEGAVPHGSADEERHTPAVAVRADSAGFWHGLLLPRWEQLQKEEEEALAVERLQETQDMDRDDGGDEREGAGDSDQVCDADEQAGPLAVHGASLGMGVGGVHGVGAGVGSTGPMLELQQQFSSRASANLAIAVPHEPLPNDEPSSTRSSRGRGGRVRGPRGGVARNGNPARGIRRRRGDIGEDDGGGGGHGGPVSGAGGDDKPLKRRRKNVMLGHGLVSPFSEVDAASPGRVPAAVVLSEVGRHEAVKRAINELGSVEHGIVQRAYARVDEIVAELRLEPHAEMVQMACQAAEILLMMRPEDEAPSDFQDYTLVSTVAVAAHLMRLDLGPHNGLPMLADKFGHDLTSLDQVFWHILTRLSFYREFHLRAQQLAAASDGYYPGDVKMEELGKSPSQDLGMGSTGLVEKKSSMPLPPTPRAPTPPQHGLDSLPSSLAPGAAGSSGVAVAPPSAAGVVAGAALQLNEVDSFSARLLSVLEKDMTQAALAQGGLDPPPGPLAALMPIVSVAQALQDQATLSVAKQVRECQTELMLLERSHTLKVQAIQKEYQDFMEKVRNKAQTAIDQANNTYQVKKVAVSARINSLVEYLQQIQLLHLQQQQQHQQQQQEAKSHANLAQSALGAGLSSQADVAGGGAASPRGPAGPNAASGLGDSIAGSSSSSQGEPVMAGSMPMPMGSQQGPPAGGTLSAVLTAGPSSGPGFPLLPGAVAAAVTERQMAAVNALVGKEGMASSEMPPYPDLARAQLMRQLLSGKSSQLGDTAAPSLLAPAGQQPCTPSASRYQPTSSSASGLLASLAAAKPTTVRPAPQVAGPAHASVLGATPLAPAAAAAAPARKAPASLQPKTTTSPPSSSTTPSSPAPVSTGSAGVAFAHALSASVGHAHGNGGLVPAKGPTAQLFSGSAGVAASQSSAQHAFPHGALTHTPSQMQTPSQMASGAVSSGLAAAPLQYQQMMLSLHAAQSQPHQHQQLPGQQQQTSLAAQPPALPPSQQPQQQHAAPQLPGNFQRLTQHGGQVALGAGMLSSTSTVFMPSAGVDSNRAPQPCTLAAACGASFHESMTQSAAATSIAASASKLGVQPSAPASSPLHARSMLGSAPTPVFTAASAIVGQPLGPSPPPQAVPSTSAAMLPKVVRPAGPTPNPNAVSVGSSSVIAAVNVAASSAPAAGLGGPEPLGGASASKGTPDGHQEQGQPLIQLSMMPPGNALSPVVRPPPVLGAAISGGPPRLQPPPPPVGSNARMIGTSSVLSAALPLPVVITTPSPPTQPPGAHPLALPPASSPNAPQPVLRVPAAQATMPAMAHHSQECTTPVPGAAPGQALGPASVPTSAPNPAATPPGQLAAGSSGMEPAPSAVLELGGANSGAHSAPKPPPAAPPAPASPAEARNSAAELGLSFQQQMMAAMSDGSAQSVAPAIESAAPVCMLPAVSAAGSIWPSQVQSAAVPVGNSSGEEFGTKQAAEAALQGQSSSCERLQQAAADRPHNSYTASFDRNAAAAAQAASVQASDSPAPSAASNAVEAGALGGTLAHRIVDAALASPLSPSTALLIGVGMVGPGSSSCSIGAREAGLWPTQVRGVMGTSGLQPVRANSLSSWLPSSQSSRIVHSLAQEAGDGGVLGMNAQVYAAPPPTNNEQGTQPQQ